MADISVLTNIVQSLYGGEILEENEAKRWMDKDEELIIGYRFPDAAKGYYLLAINDMRLLTESQMEICLERHEYPFSRILAIVYKDSGGEICLRITNGIAGALDNVFDSWKKMA